MGMEVRRAKINSTDDRQKPGSDVLLQMIHYNSSGVCKTSGLQFDGYQSDFKSFSVGGHHVF